MDRQGFRGQERYAYTSADANQFSLQGSRLGVSGMSHANLHAPAGPSHFGQAQPQLGQMQSQPHLSKAGRTQVQASQRVEAHRVQVTKPAPADRKVEGFSMNRTGTAARETRPEESRGVEEEYIHNLQQQVYYLELEISMQKDREKELASKMGGIDAGPLTENLVILKSKYSKLEDDLQARLDALTTENRELMGKNHALSIALDRNSEDISARLKELEDETRHFDLEGEKYRKAISTATAQKEESHKKLGETTKERDLLKAYAGEVRIKIDRLSSQIETQADKIEQAERFQEQLLSEKNAQVVELTESLAKAEEDLKNSSSVHRLQEKLNMLTQQRQEVEMERDNAANRIKSLQYSKELVEKSCQNLLLEKREMDSRLDDLRLCLDRERTQQEILLTNKLREREKKEMSIAQQTVEDAQRDAQYHSQALKQKINENADLFETKTKLTFDIEESKEKLSQ